MLDVLENLNLDALNIKDLALLLKIVTEIEPKEEEIEVLEWKIKYKTK